MSPTTHDPTQGVASLIGTDSAFQAMEGKRLHNWMEAKAADYQCLTPLFQNLLQVGKSPCILLAGLIGKFWDIQIEVEVHQERELIKSPPTKPWQAL